MLCNKQECHCTGSLAIQAILPPSEAWNRTSKSGHPGMISGVWEDEKVKRRTVTSVTVVSDTWLGRARESTGDGAR